MISSSLAQIGLSPNLAGFGTIVIWFSLICLGWFLGIVGSLPGLSSNWQRQGFIFGTGSLLLGMLTLYPAFVLLLKEGFPALFDGLFLMVALLPLSSICAGLIALFLTHRTKTR
jgi:hypothetical protein